MAAVVKELARVMEESDSSGAVTVLIAMTGAWKG
jgi:hypothetical protein